MSQTANNNFSVYHWYYQSPFQELIESLCVPHTRMRVATRALSLTPSLPIGSHKCVPRGSCPREVSTVLPQDLFLSLSSTPYFFSGRWKVRRVKVSRSLASPVGSVRPVWPPEGKPLPHLLVYLPPSFVVITYYAGNRYVRQTLMSLRRSHVSRTGTCEQALSALANLRPRKCAECLVQVCTYRYGIIKWSSQMGTVWQTPCLEAFY